MWVGQPHVTMLLLSRLGRRDAAVAGVTKGKALPDVVAEQILARHRWCASVHRGVDEHVARERADARDPGPFCARWTAAAARHTDNSSSLAGGPPRPARLGEGCRSNRRSDRAEFSHQLIAAVAGLSPADLDAALERLTSSGLISRRGTPPDAAYSFKHALVQDAAYATSAAGSSYMRSSPMRWSRSSPRWPKACPRSSRAIFDTACRGEANGYWRKAGQLASRRSANREAVTSFEQAGQALNNLHAPTKSPSHARRSL